MAPTGSQILAVEQKDLSSKAGRKKHERRYGPRNQENCLLTQRNTIFDNYTADGGEKKITVIEFEDEDVARIASETMNGYLMFRSLIKCRLLDRNKIDTEKLFQNWKRLFAVK